MINTATTFCTYENLYYEMWETAGRYTEVAQFQVIGKSHDDRMIPMVKLGHGATGIFCLAGLHGLDRQMPFYLLGMLKEYARAWENKWKLEELYDLRELLEKWSIYFIPLLNPDGYEIYEKDFFAIRNPIYRQMLRMQEIPCKEFACNGRGIDLRKNFPTHYYRRKQIHRQPASENETKALIRVFQECPGRGLLSFGYAERCIVYFRQSQSFATNQKNYRLARHLQKEAGLKTDKKKYHLDDVDPAGRRGYGSPEQFYAEICRQPSFRIEIPSGERQEFSTQEQTEYREIHTLPLEYLFSL
ncbi:M14 family zinc carboxypeptidase [Blautia sp. MSJ-19]|uniref:M14 family zinc carboxypeptidase n=1 Tax=Blautia sp. MSJ-19 TaxID=2841517 RepID=UPI001C0F266E|nr:M14 family zinc carboxypeptidase [Blautia sp. MSJ-19]MBU5481517.1 zinc carboxypeptidase [Blautia sp. MSJ-19]